MKDYLVGDLIAEGKR